MRPESKKRWPQSSPMLGRYVPTAVRCGLLFYLIVHSTLVGVEIFVAPHGDDTAVGSFEKPFRTLGRARDALRQRRFASETCQVWLRGGTYFQVEPLVLGPMDSGTPESPVRWAAWKNERAILSLGIRVGGWTPGTGGFWRAQVSGIRSNLTLEAFFVNGARAVRARTPNAVRRIPLVENRPLVETVGVDTGYTYVDFKGGYGKDPATGALVDLSFQSFTPLDRRLIPALATLEPPALSEVVACFVKPEGWQSARIRVARVEPGHDLIVLQGIANRRADQHAELFRGYPFYLEGFPDALDEPGEWYLDRSRGVLSYLARPGDNPETAEAFLSASGQHLVISGKGDEPVHDLVFSNLIFRHAAFATPREMVGFHGEQCAPFLEAAIQVDGARGVWFENCEISQTGACFALHFGRKCNQCGVRRTLFSDLGGGGVHLDNNLRLPDSKVVAWQSSQLVVEDCILRGGGRVIHNAAAILLHHAKGCRIVHNTIDDFYYIGVQTGWNWDYEPTPVRDNLIAWNRIANIGQGLFLDNSAIYTLGGAPATRILSNHLMYLGAQGIYNDQGSTGILIEGNIVRESRIAYFLNWGHELEVRGNVFSEFRELGAFGRTLKRNEVPSTVTLEGNLFVTGSGGLNPQWLDRGFLLAPKQLASRGNIYWNSRGEARFQEMSFAEWQQKTGQDIGSRVADPGLEIDSRGQMRLHHLSTLVGTTFKPFSLTDAGPRGDPDWIEQGRISRVLPLLEIPHPELPARNLYEDFEDIPVGMPPALPKILPIAEVVSHGLAVRVTDREAAQGKHSLLLTKNKRGLNAWMPMVCYDPQFNQGRVRIRFEAKISGAARFAFSLQERGGFARQWVGPSVLIKQGFMVASGAEKTLGAIPWDRWVRFELETELGSGGATLTWTPAGSTTMRADFPYVHRDFRRLNQLTFSDCADEDAEGQVYLDDLRVERLP